MKKIIGLMALLGASCVNAPVDTPTKTLTDADIIYRSGYTHILRVIDHDNNIVCYVYLSHNVSCLKLESK